MYSLLKTLSVILFSCSAISLSSQLNSQVHVRDTSLPLPVNVIHQFPKPTWIENLAVRSNSGGILGTILIPAPELYLIDPSTGSATLLHTFSSVAGLVGITQLGHDIFYVGGGNYSFATLVNTPGSYTVFEVDLRGYDEHGVAGVKVKELVVIKEALFFNGVTRLDAASKTLLLADSFVGGVWEVDVETGAYKLGIALPEMEPTNSPGLSLGVNGIKVKDGYLYFSNTAQETLSRVAIDEVTGAVTGAVEVLARGIPLDDFIIGEGGLIWLAQNVKNTLSVLLKNGTVVDVAGSRDSLLVPGPSACQFGLEDKLYCSSTGGLASQVNGMFVGGELLEIDTEGFDLSG